MLTNSEEIVYNSYYKLIILLLVPNLVRPDDDFDIANRFRNISRNQEILFETYLDQFHKFQKKDYSAQKRLELKKSFKANLIIIDYFNSIYTTAKFGINKYTGLSFDKFIQGYTGFNSTGLTDEGVVEFDPQYVERIIPAMDWRYSLTLYEMLYCKNSYVYSALSKYCIFHFLS